MKPAPVCASRRYTQRRARFSQVLGNPRRCLKHYRLTSSSNLAQGSFTTDGEPDNPQSVKRPFTLALNEGVIQHNPVAAVRGLKGEKAEKGALLPILPPGFIHSIRIRTNETLVSDGILGNTARFQIEMPAKSMFPSAAIPRAPWMSRIRPASSSPFAVLTFSL